MNLAVKDSRADVRAFTLIELLVVLGVVMGLVLLTVLGTRKALDSARNASSMGNLRQIAMLHHIFIQENKGWLGTGSPRGENGHGACWALHLAKIDGIIGSVNSPKPANTSAMGTVFASPWNGPDQRLDGYPGYGFNTRLGYNRDTTRFFSYKLAACPDPANTIVFAESPNTRVFWNWVNEDPAGFPRVRDGKVLVSWLDGRVTRETVEKLNETVDGFEFYYWDADKVPGQNAKQYF